MLREPHENTFYVYQKDIRKTFPNQRFRYE